MKINISKVSKGIAFIHRQLLYMLSAVIAEAALMFRTEAIDRIYFRDQKKGSFPEIAVTGPMDFNGCIGEENIIETVNRLTDSDCTLIFSPLPPTEENKLRCEKHQVWNLNWHTDVILSIGDRKIGMSIFEETDLEQLSLLQLLIRRKRLEKKGACVTIAYVKRGGNTYSNYKKSIKMIGTSGYRLVAGLGKKVSGRRTMRTLGFYETSIFYALGQIHLCKDGESISSTAVIVKLAVDEKRKRIAQQGYFPVAVENRREGQALVNLCQAQRDLLTKEEQNKILNRIQKKMKSFPLWEERILLSDIFASIGRKLPEKYAYLENYTVNSICSRTMELAPGSVFFFRQQFRDKNDLKPVNETLRLKLIFRAVMRRSLFIFSYRKLWPGIPHIVVEDGIEAHISAMAHYRRRLDTRFIGITGSIGKTSMKDMLHCALSQQFFAEKSRKNANVQVRIGVNLQQVKKGVEVYIQEIGGGRPGGASRHARMIQPEVAVITNIGTAHLGNYRSREHLMENKLGIIEGMKAGGMLFLNGDDPMLWNSRPGCPTCTFAVYNKEADYFAENIVEKNGTTSFTIVHDEGRCPVKLNVLGIYNVLNAVACFAIGKYFGMEDHKLVRGIAQFRTSGTRQNLVNVSGYRLFVDCYNASLDSVKGALSVLEKLDTETGRRYAVIGDITGMGESTDRINEELARVLDSHVDRLSQLVIYGDNAKKIAGMMKKAQKNVNVIDRQGKLERWMENQIGRGDVTLFKGSSRAKLDERIDNVFGTNFCDGKYVEEARFRLVRRGGVRYRVFSGHVTAVSAREVRSKVKLKGKTDGRSLKKIGLAAFRGNTQARHVVLGKQVLHIGSESFFGCHNLVKVKHHRGIIFIGKSAFENCEKLSDAVLPSSLRVLGAKAFKNCRALEKIRVPGSCSVIPREAFSGCSGLARAELEEGIEQLSPFCFSHCHSLSEIRLPRSLKWVGPHAFAGCRGLRRIYVEGDVKISRKALTGCDKVEIIRLQPASI